jgi:hypothetical protein
MQQFVDIKTGQMYDYYDQMRAYSCLFRKCLGWTGDIQCKIIYTDAELVVRYVFQDEDPDKYLADQYLLATNGERNPCDYCGWCAHGGSGFGSCPALEKEVEPVMNMVSLDRMTMQSVLQNPDHAGAFLSAMETMNELVDEIKDRAKSGKLYPTGYKVTECKGKASLYKQEFARILHTLILQGKVTIEEMIDLGLSTSVDNAKKLLSKTGVDELTIITSGNPYKTVSKKK